MKRRHVIVGFTLAGLVAAAAILYTSTRPSVAARAVRLVVTGPPGQRFSGTYVADDGVTNSVSAVAPATIDLRTRDLDYEFKREGGEGEFRVALYVGDLRRTSVTSDDRQGVRGELRYAFDGESYWGAGF